MSEARTKPIMAKELVDYFAAQGVKIHYAYARALIRACPHAIHGRYIRPIDAWTWWALHPEFQPFGRPPAPGDNRVLAENAQKFVITRDCS